MSLQGLNFETEKYRTLEAELARLRAENARRVPCTRCGLRVLPETMQRHLALVHPRSRR